MKSIFPLLLFFTHLLSINDVYGNDLISKDTISTSEGSVYSGDGFNATADYLIDGIIATKDANTKNYNHTWNGPTNNWVQLALQEPLNITKIEVYIRPSNEWRVAGSEVYLSNETYTGSFENATKIGTLSDSVDVQTFTLQTPINAQYLIIKEDDQFLHLTEINIYGFLYDLDEDGVSDKNDFYPDIPLNGLSDNDKDGIPDVCDQDCLLQGMTADLDDDNDGVLDTDDFYPFIPLNGLVDADNDGRPDICEADCVASGMLPDSNNRLGQVVYSNLKFIAVPSQGSTQDDNEDRFGAGNINDDDYSESSINHTRRDGKNWLQLAFPAPTVFSKIEIYNRKTAYWNLQDASVYLSNEPYSENFDNAIKIAVLDNTDVQKIELETPVVAQYLYVKDDKDFLHMREIDVFASLLNDEDGDNIPDHEDHYPLVPVTGYPDNDQDGIPDICDASCLSLNMVEDLDDDNDGILDLGDAFPKASVVGYIDSDNDGAPDDCDNTCVSLGMVADDDDDNDGVKDSFDYYRLIALIPGTDIDTDSDGIPDNCLDDCQTRGMVADDDDDNDGIVDIYDERPLLQDVLEESDQPRTALDAAILTGELGFLTFTELEESILQEIDNSSSKFDHYYIELFNLDTEGNEKSDGSSLTKLTWDTGHDSALFDYTFGTNAPLFYVAGTEEPAHLGVMGESPSRFIALGGNPYRLAPGGAQVDNTNSEFDQFMLNAVSWLTQDNDFDREVNIVAAQLDDSYWFKDASGVKQWLKSSFSNITINHSDEEDLTLSKCNSLNLSDCLAKPTDLLIISQWVSNDDNSSEVIDEIINSVKKAQERSIPVLYLHWDGDETELGTKLRELWSIKHKYDNRNLYYSLDIKNYIHDPTVMLGWIGDDLKTIRRTITNLRDENFTFSFEGCKADAPIFSDCHTVAGYQEQLKEGLDVLRKRLKNLDENHVRIFDIPELYRLEKLLVLLGDAHRKDIVYPMDKDTSPKIDFARSLYADFANFYSRDINPTQPDLGSFSRTDFINVQRYMNQPLSMNSVAPFRATGFYAFPGETFTVTRNDTSDVETRIFINSIREGTTRLWNPNGYDRPYTLKSNEIIIKPGETISLTSSYGGPIQIFFRKSNFNVEFTFDNVGKHAFWNGTEDNASFDTALKSNMYDWAELITPFFEVHSQATKMEKTIDEWGSTELVGELAMQHLHNHPLIVSGFKGPAIDVVPEIHEFASSKGWEVTDREQIQHMNADQSLCAYGCSGNPYDAWWHFDPLGHGDIHELGHNLESGRMRFEGWNYHASTNWYVYYSKSKYNKKLNRNATECSALPFKDAFDALKASKTTSDPSQYMQDNYWPNTTWDAQAAMAIQMWMSAQKQGVVEDGWHVLARLHVLERAFNQARRNDEDWVAAKTNLGFESYSRDEANNISNNNWMVIAMSVVTGHDYTDYLDAWGLPISDKARTEVINMGYPKMPIEFFITSERGYCEINNNGDFLGKLGMPVSADMLWPEEVDADSDGTWDGIEHLVTDTTDTDGDGISDWFDNCEAIKNPDQADIDGDAFGDVCDFDMDGDGIENAKDVFPLDGLDWLDNDQDGIGDNTDDDDDQDGVNDDIDAFPLDSTEQVDTDRDGVGNNKDNDDDNDAVLDSADMFPLDPTEWLDTDGDNIGNNVDIDDDDDGIFDGWDEFPLDSNEYIDTDLDGVGNNSDNDDDGDGIVDINDAYPLISLGSLTDEDGDGIPAICNEACQSLGMIEDGDDNGNGIPDVEENFVSLDEYNFTICSSSPCDVVAADQVQIEQAQHSDVVRWAIADNSQRELGMSLNTKTGLFTWTPTNNQAGNFTIQVVGLDVNGTEIVSSDISITVETNDQIDWANVLFVVPAEYAPNRNRDMTGAQEFPYSYDAFGSLFCKDDNGEPITTSKTVFFRGGLHTTDIGDNPAAIFCSGESLERPFTLTAWGNERPVLSPKGTEAIKIQGDFVTLSGFEIAGYIEQINLAQAVADWWWEERPATPEGYIITAQGILAKGRGIVIHNNLVHSWPGNAVKIEGDLSSMLDNVVFNSGYYSTRGVGGVMVEGLNDSELDMPSDRDFGIIIKNNVVFGNESRIISHVFSKDFSTLEIDEGSALNLQQNGGDYTRGYLVENNAFLYNGKGVGLRAKNVVFRDNTVYGNGLNIRAPGASGVRATKITTGSLASVFNGDAGSIATVINNVIAVPANQEAISVDNVSRISGGCSSNLIQGIIDDDNQDCGLSENVVLINDPVLDASSLDFSPLLGNAGAEQSLITGTIVKLASYGYELKPSGFDIMSIHDYDEYVLPMINEILKTTPEGDGGVELTFEDANGSVVTTVNLDDNNYEDLLDVATIKFDWLGTKPKYDSKNRFAGSYEQYIKAAPDTYYSVIATVSPVGSGYVTCSDISIRSTKNQRQVSCEAVPLDGYTFTSWSGDCSGDTCDIESVNGDVSLIAVFDSKLSETDTDNDGIPDIRDDDDDNDGVLDTADAYPLISIGELMDTDSDGAPNTCDEACVALGMLADTDDDDDGVVDLDDAFPIDPLESLDSDSDGLGDNYEVTNNLNAFDADSDADGLEDGTEIALGTNPLSNDSDFDGVLDGRDKYPLISLSGLADSDGDGAPDECDDSCLALGMMADRDGVPPYTLLEQPQPQFASLTPTAKVIVTGSDGENFFDIARYVDVVSMVGQTFLVSGSSSIDGFRVMPGVKYDLTNLKGSVDTLYFSGPLSEYAGSILLDSSTGVMQLSRLTDIGEEIVQFIASNTAADVLVFSDGAISTSEVKTAVLNNTDLTTLTLDTSVSAMDDKVTTGAQVKHIILDNNGAGAMALGPNIQTLISGSSGVDQIYVPEGSVVDASNLKSGQDKVYVQGELADYNKALDPSGNIILTREVTIDTETYTESITVASGGNVATNDLVIFADQQLDTASLRLNMGN